MTKILKFKNGLKVCVVEMPIRSVMVGFWVGTGSKFESADINGISHFTEHVMFKGTERLSPYDIANEFESYGAMINAFTSKEATCYYFKCVDIYLENCFKLLSEIFFKSTFPAVELDRERKVIVEEINMVEDAPDDICGDLVSNAVFGDTGLGQTILGPKENVMRFTSDDVREYMQQRYTADNTVIVMVGNVNEAVADQLVRSYALDSFCAQKAKSVEVSTKFYSGQYKTKFKDFEQTNIILSYPSYSIRDEVKQAEQMILSCALGGGMSSRLFQSVRERLGLAYSVYSSPSAYDGTGAFNIYLNNSPENTIKALDAVKAELDKFLSDGLTDDEFNRTKIQIISSFVFSGENVQSLMISNGKYLLRGDQPFDIDKRISDIENVTKEDVLAFARAILTPEKLSAAYVGRAFDGNVLEIMK